MDKGGEGLYLEIDIFLERKINVIQRIDLFVIYTFQAEKISNPVKTQRRCVT